MHRRETTLPLAIGTVVSLLLHLAAMPLIASWALSHSTLMREQLAASEHDRAPEPEQHKTRNDSLANEAELVKPQPKPPEPEQPRQPEKKDDDVRLGRDNAPPELATVAWISYDDFQKLVAPDGETEQPAVQQLADPAPVDVMNPDATPPATPSATPSMPMMSAPLAQATSPAEPSRQIEAKSEQPEDQPARELVQAQSQQVTNADPIHQPQATGPLTEKAPPIEQEPAKADSTAQGGPTHIDETAMMRPIGEMALNLDVPAMDISSQDTQSRQAATGPRTQNQLPREQDEARTTASDEQGKPATLEMSEATQDSAGEPTQQVATQTSQAAKDGGPAQREPVEASRDQSKQDPQETATAPSATPQQPQPVQAQPATQGPVAARPTAMPREDRDSPPVMLNSVAMVVRPGSVLTAQGIEIKTAVPSYGLITRMTAAPSRGYVHVTFDRSGRVIEVEMMQSTGYRDIDAAIMASIYKWSASGKKLEELNRSFVLKIEIIP